MTLDHTGDFDARRITWRQRRQAVRRLRRAAGLMPVDRDLRIQQARAAQTRGEIGALTRGLDAPVTPVPSAYAQLPAPPVVPTGRPVPQPSARKGLARSPLVIGLIVFVVACGGSVVSCVSSLVDAASDFSSGSSSSEAVDLSTAAGWDEMIDAFDERADLGRTTQLIASSRAATLGVALDDDTIDQHYFDGDVTTVTPSDRGSEQTFDLSAIDSSVVAEAIAQARSQHGAIASDEAWVTIASPSQGVQIRVSFPEDPDSTYVLVVDDEGTVLSEDF